VNKGISTSTWLLIGALLLAVIFLVPGLIETADDTMTLTPNDNQVQQEQQDRLSVETIIDNPDQYQGQNVELTANMGEVVSERGFTLGNPQPLSQDLLVLAPPQLVNNETELQNEVLGTDTEMVMVQGTVTRLNFDDVERTWGVTLDREALSDYENQPVLLAQRIEQVNQQVSR
jgi:hypothetical protein